MHTGLRGLIRVWIPCLTIVITSFARSAEPARIVFVIGEEEYNTAKTLPEFAKTELEPIGYAWTIIDEDSKDKNHFPGLEAALVKADLMFLSTRRRLLPKKQLDAVRAFLDSGKSLIGIRTSCHAFAPPLKPKAQPAGEAGWPEFDPEVLGGHYVGHYAVGPEVHLSRVTGAERSPLLEGVDFTRWISAGSLYRVSPLDSTCVPLLTGRITDKPSEPVAWTRLYGPGKARVFYTSLGHPDDFREPSFRRLLVNAVHWALGSDTPP